MGTNQAWDREWGTAPRHAWALRCTLLAVQACQSAGSVSPDSPRERGMRDPTTEKGTNDDESVYNPKTINAYAR